MKYKVLLVGLLLFSTQFVYGVEVPIYAFSLNPYSQEVSDYISPEHPQYKQSLISLDEQTQQLQEFSRYYYASDEKGLSPWSQALVEKVLSMVLTQENAVLTEFDNQLSDQQHHGINFKLKPKNWLSGLKTKMNLEGLELTYHAEQRAILVQNTQARVLPDEAPDFHHFSLPGSGFPFDNLQLSTLYAGTPVYVLHETAARDWALVLSPHAFFGWVKTSDLAYVSSGFVQSWQVLAKNGLMAVTETEASIQDAQSRFQLIGYIGAVFPLSKDKGAEAEIYVPVRNDLGLAKLKQVLIASKAVTRMPLSFSAEHLSVLLKSLQSRPYSWGGMYFYNDASSELQHLFTPFGIWLPRNSVQQSNMPAVLDLSSLDRDERVKHLKSQGKPLMTLIYVGGHVGLYTGIKTKGAFAGEAITYQNVWGLSPASGDKRYVIGESVFLPLLKQFPEQPDIQSQADRKYFKLVFLDRLPEETDVESFVQRYF
jgi:hypothetical protein